MVLPTSSPAPPLPLASMQAAGDAAQQQFVEVKGQLAAEQAAGGELAAQLAAAHAQAAELQVRPELSIRVMVRIRVSPSPSRLPPPAPLPRWGMWRSCARMAWAGHGSGMWVVLGARIGIRTHARTHTGSYTHTRARIHTYIHTHTCTHTYTHLHRPRRSGWRQLSRTCRATAPAHPPSRACRCVHGARPGCGSAHKSAWHGALGFFPTPPRLASRCLAHVPRVPSSDGGLFDRGCPGFNPPFHPLLPCRRRSSACAARQRWQSS